MADWTALPPDLMGLITQRLGAADLIRLASVCKSWRSFAGLPRRGGLLPWLLVYKGDIMSDNFCDEGRNLGVLSLYNRQVYWLELPEVVGTRICGSSSNGWLATVRDSSVIKLVHAFTKSQIQLPPLACSLTRIPEYIRELPIDKILVMFLDPVSPTHPDAVIAIHGDVEGFGSRLAMFRSTKTPMADNSWTLLVGADAYHDVTYYRGQFYVVTFEGCVYIIDGLDSPHPYLRLIIEPPRIDLGKRHYLVESSCELLMVSRFIDPCPRILTKTTGFRVFKIDFFWRKFVEVKSLGDRLLFLGCSTSFSVSALDIPSCCRSNCIYFTGDCFESFGPVFDWDNDLGVFNLDDGTTEPCNPVSSQFIIPSSIWLATN